MRLIISLLWKQAKRHKKKYAIACILGLLVAALWTAEPIYSSYAIDALLKSVGRPDAPYVRVFGWWGILFVALAITQALEKYAFWELDNLIILDRREDVYVHTLELGIPYHTQQKSGEIIKQLDEGADSLVDVQRTMLLELGPSFLSAVVFMVLSFWIQPILAMILVTTLILYIAIVIVGTASTSRLQYQVNKLWVEAIGRAYDAISNIASVASGAQETHELTLMRASHKNAFTRQQQVNFRWAVVESIHFFMLTRLLLVGVGIILYAKGSMTLGELYFFQFSFFRVLVPFEILGNFLPQWNRKVGKVKLSQMILDTPIQVQNRKDAKKLPALEGSIHLDHVCFSYTPVSVLKDDVLPAVKPPRMEEEEYHEEMIAKAPMDRGDEGKELMPSEKQDYEERAHSREVLHDLSFRIQAGEHIALVGHSGAGKSTLAMLFNRFYDVTKGAILVDGTDLRELDVQWWRSNIGLVLQENIMFNDTVRANIRYARPDASDEDIEDAARRAAAYEFIENLPKGFDTEIGDRGIRLSGGQRQRVAIARAILKKPKVVILDEATSALDSKTEQEVQAGIKSLIEGRTAIIIAHRLSTVRSVHRIAVLEKGNLIAFAPHEELMQTCPLYKEMVELQRFGVLQE